MICMEFRTKKISAYTQSKQSLTFFDLSNQIKEPKDNQYTWLKESLSQVLQTYLRNLNNAYTNFFREVEFPKFKSKQKNKPFNLRKG